jgi:hypothetical protein
VKENRPLSGMRALQRAKHRVALANRQERFAVMVEREDPRNLADRDAGVCAIIGREFDLDGTIGFGLAQRRRRIPSASVSGEGEPHDSVKGRSPTLRRAEPELSRGREAERSAGRDRVHVRLTAATQ